MALGAAIPKRFVCPLCGNGDFQLVRAAVYDANLVQQSSARGRRSGANHRDRFAFGWKWVSVPRWWFQLTLTHFTSLPQFEYVSQHLVFANCIPLILKFFNQNIMSYITAKNRYGRFSGRER